MFARVFLFLFTFFAFGFSQPASAAACYSHSEAEAEQGIRIHSELMVIGLNCAHIADANGNNLYVEHNKFTAKHADLFSTYEDIIMAHLKKNGAEDPEQSLNTLRTQLANKVSFDAAEMRPDIFCKTYAPRIEKATKMDHKTLRKWAATQFPGHPVSKPLCKESM